MEALEELWLVNNSSTVQNFADKGIPDGADVYQSIPLEEFRVEAGTFDYHSSRITMNLDKGDYTIEATTNDAATTGSFEITLSYEGKTRSRPRLPSAAAWKS